MNEQINKLISMGQQAGILITLQQAEKLIGYMEHLLEINKQINLTRITDKNEFIKLHLLDSLTLLKLIDKESTSILDVGTGGGFPGIPLAIVLEQSHITMMDSTRKKLNVIQTIAGKLEINNVSIVHGRAEELGQNKLYREKFDVVVSRAVANLTLLSEYCLPFVKMGGQFLSMKGREYHEELKIAQKPIRILGGEIIEVENGLEMQTEFVHVIINIKKARNTPEKFPRVSGKIKKEDFPV
jgi:16S rRNA (guanine527-N7)-methyltransferase